MKVLARKRINPQNRKKIRRKPGKFRKGIIVFGSLVALTSCMNHNHDSVDPLGLSSKKHKMSKRKVCVSNCLSNDSDPFKVGIVFVRNLSKGDQFASEYYKIEGAAEPIMVGIGNDKIRFFKVFVDGETMVRETRKRPEGWVTWNTWSGKEAENAWRTIRLSAESVFNKP